MPTAARKTPAPLIRGDLRRRKIAELAERILVHGQRPLEAGSALGLTREQIYGMMEGDDFKRTRDELLCRLDTNGERMLDAVLGRLRAMALKAVERTEQIMLKTLDDAVALRACNSVLDRVGARAHDDKTAVPVLMLSADQLAALADALKIAQALQIEVTPTTDDDHRQ